MDTTGLAVDMIATTFMCIFMSAVMTIIVTGRALRSMALNPLPGGGTCLPGNAVMRELVVAISGAVPLGLFAPLGLSLAGAVSIGFFAVLVFKTAYGIAIGLAFAHVAAIRVLKQRTLLD